MTTLKIIEGQREEFNSKFVAHITSEKGNIEHDRAVIFFEDTVKIYDWHKQSIIQILESEIDRKMGMKKEEYYCCAMHGSIDGVLCECIGETFGYNQAIQEDIAHLTVLLDSLK